MSEFHAEAPQATASEGLAQGLYLARFEPKTLRTKGYESTNEPPRPTKLVQHVGVFWNYVSYTLEEPEWMNEGQCFSWQHQPFYSIFLKL